MAKGAVRFLAALLVLPASSGCASGTNVNVTAAASMGLPFTQAVQSETTMVRQDLMGGQSRLILAYNDQSGQLLWLGPGAGNWAFDPNSSRSAMGWAISNDGGLSWARQPQIPAPAGDPVVAALLGDPSLATGWVYTAEEGAWLRSIVLYANLGQSNLSSSGGSGAVVVARLKDNAPSFEDPIVVAGPDVTTVPDGTQVAIASVSPYEQIAMVAWTANAGRAPFVAYRIIRNLGIDPGMALDPSVGAIDPTSPSLGSPFTCLHGITPERARI